MKCFRRDNILFHFLTTIFLLDFKIFNWEYIIELFKVAFLEQGVLILWKYS